MTITKEEPMNNAHPSGIDVDAIAEAFTYNVGSAVSFLWQAEMDDSTDQLEDLENAAWYVSRAIEQFRATAGPDQAPLVASPFGIATETTYGKATAMPSPFLPRFARDLAPNPLDDLEWINPLVPPSCDCAICQSPDGSGDQIPTVTPEPIPTVTPEPVDIYAKARAAAETIAALIGGYVVEDPNDTFNDADGIQLGEVDGVPVFLIRKNN